jgi:hypothetical protein
MSLGLFLSAFAHTEFQAMQFMPAFVFPQLLLCGLIVRRAEMARALEVASYFLPLTYAYDALDRSPISTSWTPVSSSTWSSSPGRPCSRSCWRAHAAPADGMRPLSDRRPTPP